MLKYVTVNFFPLAHTASGQNGFLFFTITADDSSHETGRSSWGSDNLALVLCHMLKVAPRYHDKATDGWGYPALLPLWFSIMPSFPQVSSLADLFVIQDPFCQYKVLGSSTCPLHTHLLSPQFAVVLDICGLDLLNHTEQVPGSSALNCSLALMTGSSLWVVWSQSSLFQEMYFEFID